MKFRIHCGYCPTEWVVDPNEVVRAPARDFIQANCPNCNSRHALDVKVRKIRKSASIKKKQKADKEKHERAVREAYEKTADSLLRPWSSLSKWDKINLTYKLKF